LRARRPFCVLRIMTTTTKIGLVSLGCPKNLVDSEELLGALVETGRAELVGADSRLDVVVVNTCAFIESAKQESIDAILAQLQRRKRGEVGRVVVAGCLAQRYGAELAAAMPEVDAFIGIQSAGQISDVVFGKRGVSLPMAGNLVAPITEKYPLIPPSHVLLDPELSGKAPLQAARKHRRGSSAAGGQRRVRIKFNCSGHHGLRDGSVQRAGPSPAFRATGHHK
jgi:hypothetical protein